MGRGRGDRGEEGEEAETDKIRQSVFLSVCALHTKTSRRSVHIREVSGALQRAFRDVTVGALSEVKSIHG